MSARQTVLSVWFRLDSKMKSSIAFLALLLASLVTIVFTQGYVRLARPWFPRLANHPTKDVKMGGQQNSGEVLNSLELENNQAKRRKNIRQILLRYPTLMDRFFPYFLYKVGRTENKESIKSCYSISGE